MIKRLNLDFGSDSSINLSNAEEMERDMANGGKRRLNLIGSSFFSKDDSLVKSAVDSPPVLPEQLPFTS